MVTIGGNNYKWRGTNIRTIKSGDITYVTMPRKNSEIVIPINVESDNYIIKIDACNKGGNGNIAIFFDNFSVKQLYVKSKTRHIYEFAMQANASCKWIKIKKRVGSTGNVLIHSISYTKKIEKPKKQINDPVKQIKLEQQLKLIQLQNEREKIEREKKNRDILEKRGINMAPPPVTIGGSDYRWLGKNIRTLYKFNSTCVCISKLTSNIMVPVKVKPNTRYKVSVSAANEKNQDRSVRFVHL